MERSSQVLSDFCVKKLAAAQDSSLESLEIQSLSYKHSLKYSILHQGQIKIEIKSATSFAIFEGESDVPTADGQIIAEARLTDFLLGANRVKTHYQDLIKAKDAHVSSAWLLVTAYYCCFFSCIELLKFNNHIQLGFDPDDLSLLEPRATGPEKAAFFQGNTLNFVGRIKANKIVFESNGSKPHTSAWFQLKILIESLFGTKSWQETDMLCKILLNPILNPSRVRNNWNYKRADYFGATGEQFGIPFKKLLGNSKGAAEWLIKNGATANADDSARIAALCELIAPSIIDAYNRIRSKS